MTTTTNVTLALGDAVPATALTPAVRSVWGQAVAQGGPPVQQLMEAQWNLYAAFSAAGGFGMNIQVDQNGMPNGQASAGGYSVTMQPEMNQNVVNGTTPPTPITVNGTQYNWVGDMLLMMAGPALCSYFKIPIGIGTGTPQGQYQTLLWGEILSPVFKNVLQTMVKLMNQCLTTDTQDAAEAVASDLAEDDVAFEGLEIGEIVLALDCGPGLVLAIGVGIALPAIINLLQDLNHNLLIMNGTPYDLALSVSSLGEDEGYPTVSPASNVIPAAYLDTSVSPSIGVIPQANYTFVSSTDFTNLEYQLEIFFIDPSTMQSIGGPVTAQFVIPKATANKLALDGQALSAVTQMSSTIMLNNNIAVNTSITFDYLHGEHSAPNGNNAWLYNSLVYVQIS